MSQAIEDLLIRLEARAAADEGLHRDRWHIFAPHPIKSPARVRTKLLGDAQQPTTPAELRDRVLALGDLARLRIVASLQRDVRTCFHALVSEGATTVEGATTMLGRFPVANVKDFVRDDQLRRPLAGHRAIQFVVMVPAEGFTPKVEIQIMTSLQHAWDRRNHCVYEWLREGGRDREATAIDLRVDDHALAETLHVADALADHNFETFLRLRRENP